MTVLGFPMSIFRSHCITAMRVFLYCFLSLCILQCLVPPLVCYSLTHEVKTKASAGSFLDYPGNVGIGSPHGHILFIILRCEQLAWQGPRETGRQTKQALELQIHISRHGVKFGKISQGQERQPCCLDQLDKKLYQDHSDSWFKCLVNQIEKRKEARVPYIWLLRHFVAGKIPE